MPYVNIESGLLRLPAELTWDNSIDLLGVLREMQAHPTVKEIELQITSTGGALLPAFAISQILRTSTKPVTTIGAGYIASAAVTILAAGQPGRRYAYEGSVLMLHEPSSTLHEASRRSPTTGQWQKEVDAQALRVGTTFWMLSVCTGKAVAFWRERLENQPDQYFQVDEAKALGLIDEILPVSKPA